MQKIHLSFKTVAKRLCASGAIVLCPCQWLVNFRPPIFIGGRNPAFPGRSMLLWRIQDFKERFSLSGWRNYCGIINCQDYKNPVSEKEKCS